MITMRSLQKMTFALPRCYLGKPDKSGHQFIHDSKGVAIGNINWNNGQVLIFEDYEYSEEVFKALTAKGEIKSDVSNQPEEVA